MNKVIIDTNFDFRNDTKCGDPDRDSKKLYECHKLLWMKELPCGQKLDLEIISNYYGQILLKIIYMVISQVIECFRIYSVNIITDLMVG